ncbi:hypothetical protein QJS10_CPB19g01421 [Acorus calamus]|uniref:UspA domain-containing protein n=1 Tax=Acorus calamus TaxID=4465 RepID=A0AAV9CF38_ACOCL|nr:hypothetical protein QJS10_CPB19g01421 [Acorus calamus]
MRRPSRKGLGNFALRDLKQDIARYDRINHVQGLQITDYDVEIVEGDPRNVLCDAVERHHADILVVGSHGYGKLKRAILGSVSDHCAHHAHCSVLIAKKPKMKAKK